MDALIGGLIVIGSIIGFKMWISYIRFWYGYVKSIKMMMKLGGPEFVKNMNLGEIMKNAAKKLEKEEDEDDDGEMMYQ